MRQVTPPQIILPSALRPGDRVDLVVASGPLEPGERTLLDRGAAQLEALGLHVHVSPLAASRERYRWLAARPDVLADDLNRALRDPDVRAVVPLAGGQAAAGYLDLVDYDAIQRDPKPILGFSDISSLLLAIHQRTGVVTFHAELGAHGFGKWVDKPAPVRDLLAALYRRLLTAPEALGDLPRLGAWETWRPGRAQGRMLGGMLNRVVRGQAGSYAIAPEQWQDAVLFWEEAWTSTGTIWLDLHALRHAGILDRISAMVVGAPLDLRSTGSAEPLRDIVLDVLGDRDIPVLGNLDFGHTLPNLPLPLGVQVEVNTTEPTVRLLEPAVT